jgi:hypothetical protein
MRSKFSRGVPRGDKYYSGCLNDGDAIFLKMDKISYLFVDLFEYNSSNIAGHETAF